MSTIAIKTIDEKGITNFDEKVNELIDEGQSLPDEVGHQTYVDLEGQIHFTIVLRKQAEEE